MSVVIVGGNDGMTRQYKDICKAYQCHVKVFTQMHDGLKNKIGSPDLLVLFTGTVSHKMLRIALNATSKDTRIIRSHRSSATALRNILQEHTIEKS